MPPWQSQLSLSLRRNDKGSAGNFSHCNGADGEKDAWRIYDYRTEGEGHINKKDLDLKKGENESYNALGDSQGDASLEAGRKQVARIVGRDTSSLTDQEVRTAALETLAENLSDGVIAPLFWYFLLGVPGMLAYKMVNTLDSMIGYRNARYKDFGCWAARMDDVANYLPARLTSLLMILVSGRWSLLKFVAHYGQMHASPNSGYPEAALAGILNCRFGGPHDYFGETVYKPFIGDNPRPLDSRDMRVAIRVNRGAELLMLLLMIGGYWFVFQ